MTQNFKKRLRTHPRGAKGAEASPLGNQILSEKD